MTIRAVMFDFSGTLFRLEQDETWLADPTDSAGNQPDSEQQAALLSRLTTPAGWSAKLAPEYRDAWEQRDLDPTSHRKVYLELMRSSGIGDQQAQWLYAKLIDPYSWTPYPDTAEVLRRLHNAGIRTAVISNIAFDVRPAFENLGVDHLIDEVLLSYTEGLIKPDPKLFLRACERLDVGPEQALMVGDSERADGGAAAAGCQVAIVDPVPTAQRTDALLRSVGRHVAEM